MLKGYVELLLDEQAADHIALRRRPGSAIFEFYAPAKMKGRCVNGQRVLPGDGQ